MRDYRDLSLWFDQLGDTLAPRPALGGDIRVDVAVVGGGYSGLWTAYYLLRADPRLQVAVLEAQIAGFGASGRNGGWCSALFPLSASRLARESGASAARAQLMAVRESIDAISRVCAEENIDAQLARGGTVVLARNPAQLQRARDEVAEAAPFGLDLQLLDAAQATAIASATGVLGGTYTEHCAALQPARLVRGLARAVEARGGRIYEGTPATAITPGAVHTSGGVVRADVVVRATEAFTARLPGLRRAVAPVYSLIIGTEPLPEATWRRIGLARRETFSDYRNLIVYGQRTADGRLVFGGRGAPYHFASRIDASFDRVPAVFDALAAAARELFPVLGAARITHRWGGPLAIARDWHASVGLDRHSGVGWAGGYAGDGVATANLAGRTLAELITGGSGPLTELPWVGHRSPAWEPEPLRWLGVNAGLGATRWADRIEARRGRRSRLAPLVDRLTGG